MIIMLQVMSLLKIINMDRKRGKSLSTCFSIVTSLIGGNSVILATNESVKHYKNIIKGLGFNVSFKEDEKGLYKLTLLK